MKNTLDNLIKHANGMNKLGGLKRHPDFSLLVEATSFLPVDAHAKTRLWHVVHNIYDVPTCKVCPSRVTWRKDRGEYNVFCSSKCGAHDSDTQNKRNITNKERYGHTSPLVGLRDNIKLTLIERYGVDNASKNRNIAKKISSTHASKRQPNTEAELQDLIDLNLTQAEIGDKLGLSQVGIHHRLKRYNLKTNTPTGSAVQREVLQYVTSLGITGIENESTILAPKQIDIFVPAHKLGIEINGVHWHGERSGRDRKYHLDKIERAEAFGVKLIMFSDVDWNTKQDIIKARLSHVLGLHGRKIGARKCTCRELTDAESDAFLKKHHFQGGCNSPIRFGLIWEGDLLAVMTFSKNRFGGDGEYELVRFCAVGSVVGAASKLLNAFIATHTPKSIISYADRQWSQGQLYRKLGFVFGGNTKPSYRYFHSSNATKTFSRMQFQKHKLQSILDSFDPKLTEWDNMVNNGYDRIWNAGNSRWLLTLP